MKLIVVDPRRVGLASKADVWLRVRPGSDGALALGLANLMIRTAGTTGLRPSGATGPCWCATIPGGCCARRLGPRARAATSPGTRPGAPGRLRRRRRQL